MNMDSSTGSSSSPQACLRTNNRKDIPLVSGLIDYFPNALAAVAELSLYGNKQHYPPGTDLHWNFTVSSDHADTLCRHLVDRGTKDVDGIRHSTKVVWRALALLETELIEAGAIPGRARKVIANEG